MKRIFCLSIFVCAAAISSSQSVFRNWVRTTLYATQNDQVVTVRATKNGQFLVIARTSTGHIIAAHFRNGGLIGTQPLGSNSGSPILLPAPDGSVFVVSSQISGGAEKDEVRIQKFSSDLTPLLSKSFHALAGNFDRVVDAKLDSANQVHVAFDTFAAGGDTDICYLRVDSELNNEFQRRKVFGGGASLQSLAVTPDGHAAMSGIRELIDDGFYWVLDPTGSDLALKFRPLIGVLQAFDTAYDQASNQVFGCGFSNAGSFVDRFNLASGTIETVASPAIGWRQIELGGDSVYAAGPQSLIGGDANGTSITSIQLPIVGAFASNWLKSFTIASNTRYQFREMFVESSGEQYYLAATGVSGGHLKDLYYKLSPTGVVRWSQAFSPDVTQEWRPASLAVHEPSGDVFIGGDRISSILEVGLLQAPIAVPDTYRPKKNTLFNSPTTLTFNDRYFLGAVCALDTQASHGTVTVNANRTFTYTPNTNFTGTDTFKYKLTKANVNTTTATVTLIVGN